MNFFPIYWNYEVGREEEKLRMKLSQFLSSLSISGATENTWDVVINAGYDTLDKIREMSQHQLAQIERPTGVRIGEVNAEKIFESLHSDRVTECCVLQHFLQKSEDSVETELPNNISLFSNPPHLTLHSWNGMHVVMTGEGPAPRQVLSAVLSEAGVIKQSSVSKNTDLLIAARDDTVKARKATALGIKVVSYSEVFNLGE